jgi:ribosomal protein S18 acetylase RimI-like enzyme
VDPRIRDATEADLPRLVELLDQLSLDGSREAVESTVADEYRAAFDAIQRDANQRLLVLEADGELMGSLVLVIVPNLTHRGKPWATIENVVIDERARGSGLGRRMIQYAIEQAKAAGCYKVALTSHKDREDAHRFYESLGFVSTHEAYRIQLQD